MDLPDRSPEPTSICIGCGLCCDGTLHHQVEIAPDDEPAVIAAGLSIREADGKSVFRQPCPKFCGGVCSIYAARPGVCRSYTCKLLDDVNQERISIVAARQAIALAKRLAGVLQSADPAVTTSEQRAALWRRLQACLPDLEGDARERAAKILLDIGALDYCLDRWFRKSGSSSGA